MSLWSTFALALLLTARPVARTYRGPLDGLEVSRQAVAVLAKFDGLSKTQAQATLDDVVQKLKLTGAVRVSFIRTPAGNLAALEIDAERVHFGRYSELARVLSAKHGVAETYAYVSPGARDDALEGEATFSFAHGEPVESHRQQYRDDPKYLDFVRKKTPGSTWRLARWPEYPLSALARALELPGRAALEFPAYFASLASQSAPTDAGENLVLVTLDLPGGTTTEIQQFALKQKCSMSKAIADALEAARKAGTLGKQPVSGEAAAYDEGQPDSEKHSRRELTVYLPAVEQEHADDAGAGRSISLSRVVQYAWRAEHKVPKP